MIHQNPIWIVGGFEAQILVFVFYYLQSKKANFQFIL